MSNATTAPADEVGVLIDEFKEALALGASAYLAAGRKIARIFEIDPGAMPRVAAAARIPPAAVRKFRDIGRGLLLPELFTAAVKVRTLPVAHQRMAASGTLPCVVETAAGYDVRRVDLLAAGRDVMDQMVGPEGLRSEAEQIAFLKSSARRKRAQEVERQGAPDARWTFHEGQVYVTRLGIVTPDMVRAMARDYGIELRGR